MIARERLLILGALGLAALCAVAAALPLHGPRSSPVALLREEALACPPCKVTLPLPPVPGAAVVELELGSGRVWMKAGPTGRKVSAASRGRLVLEGPADEVLLAGLTAKSGPPVVRELRASGLPRAPARVAVLAVAEVVAGVVATGVIASLARARGALLAAGGVGAAIVAGVTTSREHLDRLLLALPGATREDLKGGFLHPTLPFFVQKILGHGGGFLLLGAFGAFAGAALGPVALRLATLALVSESFQLLIPGRSGRVEDLALDVIAGLLGWATARAAVRARTPRTGARAAPGRP